MCTYVTVNTEVSGSGKGPGQSWRDLTTATVYFDHPVHAMAGHTLNIDFAVSGTESAERIALELTADSARRLVAAIEGALAEVPADLLASG